eukprot:sb/3466234/
MLLSVLNGSWTLENVDGETTLLLNQSFTLYYSSNGYFLTIQAGELGKYTCNFTWTEDGGTKSLSSWAYHYDIGNCTVSADRIPVGKVGNNTTQGNHTTLTEVLIDHGGEVTLTATCTGWPLPRVQVMSEGAGSVILGASTPVETFVHRITNFGDRVPLSENYTQQVELQFQWPINDTILGTIVTLKRGPTKCELFVPGARKGRKKDVFEVLKGADFEFSIESCHSSKKNPEIKAIFVSISRYGQFAICGHRTIDAVPTRRVYEKRAFLRSTIDVLRRTLPYLRRSWANYKRIFSDFGVGSAAIMRLYCVASIKMRLYCCYNASILRLKCCLRNCVYIACVYNASIMRL